MLQEKKKENNHTITQLIIRLIPFTIFLGLIFIMISQPKEVSILVKFGVIFLSLILLGLAIFVFLPISNTLFKRISEFLRYMHISHK